MSASYCGTVSGYFGSVQDFSEGMKVRDWLAGQDFEKQYEFGIKTFEKYGE